ncbi:hypothetical protein V8E51_016711 [Hyaloscypha variabilis]
MAANAIICSVSGAAFPSFTATMYKHLRIHWVSSIPAFLALICMPFPFVFARYGAAIRKRCKYAAEAQNALDEMLNTSGGEGENVTDMELLEEEAKLDLEKRTTVKTADYSCVGDAKGVFILQDGLHLLFQACDGEIGDEMNMQGENEALGL